MAKLQEEQRKNHNRAIVLIIFALIVLAWVVINAGEFIFSVTVYGIILGISLLFYFIWSRF